MDWAGKIIGQCVIVLHEDLEKNQDHHFDKARVMFTTSIAQISLEILFFIFFPEKNFRYTINQGRSYLISIPDC